MMEKVTNGSLRGSPAAPLGPQYPEMGSMLQTGPTQFIVSDGNMVATLVLAFFMAIFAVITFALQYLSNRNTNLYCFNKREWDVANQIANYCYTISEDIDILIALPRKVSSLVHRNAAKELLLYKYRLYLQERNHHRDIVTDYCHLHDEEMILLKRLHDAVKQIAHLYSQIYIYSRMEYKMLLKHSTASPQILQTTGVKRVVEKTADLFCKLHFFNDPENAFTMVSHVYKYLTKREMKSHDLNYAPNHKRLLEHLQNHSVDSNIKISEKPRSDYDLRRQLYNDVLDGSCHVIVDKTTSLPNHYMMRDGQNHIGSRNKFEQNRYSAVECHFDIDNVAEETDRLFPQEDSEGVDVTDTAQNGAIISPPDSPHIPICNGVVFSQNSQCRFSVASNDTTY